jgi:hypothetical protein
VISEDALVEKFAAVRPFLNEKRWRAYLVAEAQAIGRGGITLVARLSGAARATVQNWVNELRADVAPDGRVRAPGAGRPAVEDEQVGIEAALGGSGRAGDPW